MRSSPVSSGFLLFETSNIGYTRRRKKKHNTICVGHHYMQTNTNSVNKTCGNRNVHHSLELRTYRHIIEQHKKNKKIRNTDPTKKPGVDSGALKG